MARPQDTAQVLASPVGEAAQVHPGKPAGLMKLGGTWGHTATGRALRPQDLGQLCTVPGHLEPKPFHKALLTLGPNSDSENDGEISPMCRHTHAHTHSAVHSGTVHAEGPETTYKPIGRVRVRQRALCPNHATPRSCKHTRLASRCGSVVESQPMDQIMV